MDLSWLGGSGDFADVAHWSPAQAPSAADAVTIADVGPYSVAIGETDAVHSLTLDAAGATVADNGELDLIGPAASLTVQAGLFQLNASGAIRGGVLSTSGSGAFAWNGGALAGVTYWGNLDLSAPNQSLTITGGLTLAGAGGAGPGQLTVGDHNAIQLLDGQTLDGGAIQMGPSANIYATVDAAGEVLVGGAPAEQFITFGPHLTLTGPGSLVVSDGGFGALGLINQGTINITGGYAQMNPASFANSGALNVVGPEFDLNTAFTNTGTVSVNGGLIFFSPTSSVTNAAGATMTANGGSFIFAGPNVQNDGAIIVNNGSVSVNFGPSSHFGDLETTNSSFSVFGAFTTAQLLSLVGGRGEYTSIQGDLDNTGAVIDRTGPLSLFSMGIGGTGRAATITGGVLVGNGGDTDIVNGVFNGVALRGAMAVDGVATILRGTTFAGADGAGAGQIDVGDNATVDVVGAQTLDHVTIHLAGGRSALYLDIAKADYVANGYRGLDQTLTLGPDTVLDQTGGAGYLGANYFEYDEANLVNQGLIKVEAGRLLVSRTKSFTNSGAILVSGGSFTVQATTLVNTGAITINARAAVFADAIDNEGAITLAGGLLIAANLTGSGHVVGYGVLNITSSPPATVEASGGELDVFNIGAGASLTIDAGASLSLQTPTAATVAFAGAGVLKLAQPLTYTGTLAALADGAVIDLFGLTATGPAVINGASVQIATSGGVVTLAFAAAPTGAFTVSNDGAGGTDLTYVDGTTTTATVGSETIVQRFAAAGAQTTAQITSLFGSITEVQNFDGAWNQTSATLTSTLSDGVIVQQFGATWSQTSAIITRHVDAATTVVQAFDAAWNQTGATITRHPDANTTIVQTFDGAWSQTGATRTYVDPSGATVVQTFDGAWNQIGATVTSPLAGGAVEVQDFDGAWTQLDARITTPIAGGAGTQEAFYDGGWNLTAIIDNQPNGFKTWTDYGLATAQTFDADFAHATTFVFAPGTIDGDTLNGLRGFGAMGALHDVVDFSGYGAGASVSQVDATTWQIASTGHATETFTVAAGTSFLPGDYIFT